MVDEVLGDAASVLVCDFYAAYHHYDGPKQRCGGTSTTCEPSTQRTRHWSGGPKPSAGFTTGPKPALISQRNNAAPPNWLWNGSCSPSAGLSWMTRWPFRPGCAGASSATSGAGPVLDTGNCSSSWPNRRRHRTTTPPSAAGDIWSSAARSAAAPGQNGAPLAR